MPFAVTSPWRRLGRVGLCIADAVGRYLLIWVAAWLVYALTAPRRHELASYLPRTHSYWEDTAHYLWDGPIAWVGLMVGIPSLLVILLFGLLNKRKGAAFRTAWWGSSSCPHGSCSSRTSWHSSSSRSWRRWPSRSA